MIEAEWLGGNDPTPMLEFLRGKASDRKLRLFAVACCRRISHPTLGEYNLAAIQTVENYAEGIATDSELVDAGIAALDEYNRLVEIHGVGPMGGIDNPVDY